MIVCVCLIGWLANRIAAQIKYHSFIKSKGINVISSRNALLAIAFLPFVLIPMLMCSVAWIVWILVVNIFIFIFLLSQKLNVANSARLLHMLCDATFEQAKILGEIKTNVWQQQKHRIGGKDANVQVEYRWSALFSIFFRSFYFINHNLTISCMHFHLAVGELKTPTKWKAHWVCCAVNKYTILLFVYSICVK